MAESLWRCKDIVLDESFNLKSPTNSPANLNKEGKSTKECLEESRRLIRNLRIRLKDESEDIGEKIKINLKNIQDIGDLVDIHGDITEDIEDPLAG